ncbi:Smarcc1 protein [Mycena olivaceomarginata]|nr:Smarcc1 protein [Mycena olivaceomarginata]
MDSPKRAGSPSPGASDAKRMRLSMPPGKRSELEPLPSTDLANLPSEDWPSRPENDDDDGGDVSMGDGADDEGDSGDENDDEDPAQLEAARLRLEDQARKYLAAQTREFFNSRNHYRDFMINTYRLRPMEYLTVTACRRNLAGDVCAIMRVHAFLEQWGLVNYQIDPDSRPAALAPPFTGHFRVILDTPRGLQSLHPGTRHQNPGAAAVNGAKKPPPTPSSLELRSSIYQTSNKSSRPIDATEADALANGPRDGTVNGASRGPRPASIHATRVAPTAHRSDTTPSRRKSLSSARLATDGRFPSSMFSGDFVKLTAAAGAPSDDWTDQEVLLLLEGVEMFDDDWSRIEEYVGTRTAQQCIRKFLELPIEDPYLATEASMGPLRHGRIPFEQADNPVMSVVAFLAGVTALHHLTNEEKGATKTEDGDSFKREGTNGASSSKPATPGPGSDSMAVDSPPKKHTVQHSQASAAALADAEDTHIRSTLASLIKLTLTKLELKMGQFEELEEILEDERKGLESARMALVGERLNLKKMLDNVRNELARNGGMAAAHALSAAGWGIWGWTGEQGRLGTGNILQLS